MWTDSGDPGELSAGAEQATLQQVPLLDDTLHGGRVLGAHLDLLAGRQQRRLQGVLVETHNAISRVDKKTTTTKATKPNGHSGSWQTKEGVSGCRTFIVENK